MNISIDRASEADLPAILSLYARLGQDDGEILDLAEAGLIFARITTYPDYRLYVARLDGRIAGTFALLIMDNLGHRGARSAILEDVVVADDLRGQGIGKEMMRYAGSLCQEKGCYKLALSSNSNREAAHRFYESLGFERHGFSYFIPIAQADSSICQAECQDFLGSERDVSIEGQIT